LRADAPTNPWARSVIRRASSRLRATAAVEDKGEGPASAAEEPAEQAAAGRSADVILVTEIERNGPG